MDGKKQRREIWLGLDLPLDVVLNLPRVTIIGRLGVSIENHRGLIRYSPQEIIIGVGKGQIAILGRRLEIEEVSRDDMIVRGPIEAVRMET